MFFVLGQVFKGKELCGYRIFDVESKTALDISLDKVRKACTTKDIKFYNAYFKPESGILIGTQGSLTNYQSIYDNGVLFGKKKVMICYKIYDEVTDKLGGYGICDGYGMLVNVNIDKFLSICSKYEHSNFELVQNKKGRLVPKPLGDVDFISVKMKTHTAKKGYNSALGEKGNADICSEIVTSSQSNMLPTINVYSYNDIKTSEFSMSAQEKMFNALSNMKRLTPYYHTMLMSVKREASTSVPTMAVTEDTMYYNLEFVSTLTVAEITFVLIHEVCHIAMRHSIRHGSKDNMLWNIATDLYINSIISRDFNCYYGRDAVEFDTVQGKASIKVPQSGIHLSTINEDLDFAKDTPETIYARLLEENPIRDFNTNGKSNLNDGDNGSGSSSKNSSSNDGSSDSSKSSQSSSSSKDGSGSNGSSDNSNSSQSNSNSEDASGSNNDSSDTGLDGKGVSTSRSSLSEEGTEVDQKDIYSSTSEVTVTYNGKKLTGSIPMDIMTVEIGDNKDRNERVADKALSTIQDMKTAVEVKEDKTGEKLVKNAGLGGTIVQRCIDFGLSTLVDWRVYLRNCCKSNHKKMYTLGQPNDVYMNAGITVASRRKIGKPTEIKGIKICVDVSGSVSEAELQYYLSEVNNILTKFEVEGELIYWSTMIGDAGNFSDLRDMLKVKPITSGGTDVRCVFDYLAKKTRVNSKYEETPIKDISCVIIFTDGCFKTNYEDYARYFGKKVIWVIPDSRFMFNPPFGKIACMD